MSDHPAAPDADPAWIASHARVQRVPSRDLTLFIRRDFLSAAECAALIERIEANRRPSTIADANGDGYFRTSETCDLDHGDPFVATIDAKLAAFAGIDPAYGEPIQGQRYDVGQEFKAHTDYFDPKGADYPKYCSVAGNRTWTLMVYLDRTQGRRRDPLSQNRQDHPAGNRQVACVEQPDRAGPAQSREPPPWHEGSRGREECHHQMVSRKSHGDSLTQKDRPARSGPVVLSVTGPPSRPRSCQKATVIDAAMVVPIL